MIRKTNLECSLQQIANTILLNTGQINNLGLLDGKIGISLFLYHYSQINGNSVYRNYADELLDEVFNNLYDTMPVDFVSGLTGIGWVIHNLIDIKMIDANGENILENIDTALNTFNYSDVLSDTSIICPFCSKGIYFLERRNTEILENILNISIQSLDQNTIDLPLNYLNSILYIISQNNNLEISENSLSIIYKNMMNSIKNKYYTFPDALILTQIIKEFKQMQMVNWNKKEWEGLLKMLDYDNLTGIFNTGIYNLIYNKIKTNDSIISNKIETINLANQINFMIKDVYKKLDLYNGLAGVGLTLCNYFQKQYETI